MTANIKLKWDLDKIRKKLMISDNDVDELGNEILTELANRLCDLIEEKSPFDTGVYSKDWKVNDVDGNKITVSNPDDKLFTILELTQRRAGRIHGKPFLYFTIGGQEITVAFVDPGGSRPQPHVRPALEQLGRESKELIVKIIKKRFLMFSWSSQIAK